MADPSPFPTPFPYFPRFPPEVRLKIWDYAYLNQSSRIIEFETTETYRPKTRYLKHIPRSQLAPARNFTPVPPLLHACSESRKEALKVYRRFFGKGYYLFFNPALDTLSFQSFDGLHCLLTRIKDLHDVMLLELYPNHEEYLKELIGLQDITHIKFAKFGGASRFVDELTEFKKFVNLKTLAVGAMEDMTSREKGWAIRHLRYEWEALWGGKEGGVVPELMIDSQGRRSGKKSCGCGGGK